VVLGFLPIEAEADVVTPPSERGGDAHRERNPLVGGPEEHVERVAELSLERGRVVAGEAIELGSGAIAAGVHEVRAPASALQDEVAEE
jgi:hypothetical protein